MLEQLEKIAGKVANTPRPPLPGGVVEEAPEEDSPDMVTTAGTGTYLPAGVVIEYSDDNEQWSVRRVTLHSAALDGDEPTITGYCHLRQDFRRFRTTRMIRILDPHGAAGPYASPAAFLDRFRCDRSPDGTEDPIRSLIRAARHELTVLMFFSRCDGYLHPAERSVILDYISQTYGDDAISPDDLWETVRRLYPDSATMLASAKAIVEAEGSDTLDTLRMSIRRLIEADGVIHNNEALHAIELAYLSGD